MTHEIFNKLNNPTSENSDLKNSDRQYKDTLKDKPTKMGMLS